MAKHVIVEAYTFTPSTRTVVVTGKLIRREQLLLITNTTTNTVIYNFSDSDLKATSYTLSTDASGLETTTIILNYNTTSMSSTDKLAIHTEETYHEIIPSEVMRDPVDKLRVSTPQSLIDTDFEYGIQPTKWEQVTLMNNRPTSFFDVTNVVPSVSNITASGSIVTVSTSNTTGIAVGTPVFLTGSLDTAIADGYWVVDTVSTNVNFTFRVIGTPAASLYDATKTYIYSGNYYSGASIPTSSIATAGNTTITVTTINSHGLRVGDGIFINGTTGASGGPVNGVWIVASTPTVNTFTYTTAASASGTITLSAGSSATLYPRPVGYIEHRPFDGGVQFSNETPYHGYQVVRQTRRYFRYQSGKGVQFSTGSVLKPSLAVDSMTSSGTTVTVTCRYPHGLLPGATVTVSGCTETAYNGTFAVVTAPTGLTFTYTALTTPSASPATGFPITVTFNSWWGSANRVGMFDSQNGFFFEFDGQQLWAVRRSSTAQISGKIAVNSGANTVTGTNTRFADQLKPGDSIVIRGMTYFVQSITSQTQMFIYPEYRASSNLTNAIVSKTIDTRYPQSQWNIDKCDGTGHSGFNINLARMQMFVLDYSWYGAGAIRFGFKNQRGEVFYAHRITNSNVNTEAYMRSGNMPARYETNTLPPRTFLTASLTSAVGAGGTISVADTSLFPSSGTVVISNAGNTGVAIEYISYSAKTSTTFTVTARGLVGGAVATNFTYSATAPILVELYSPQAASTINHWGSSVIMDGRYDDDKSFLFNYGQNAQQTYITAGTRYAVFSIRLAPTVDNGLSGVLGAREIVNRMQLTLESLGVYVTGAAVRVELILNGRVSGSPGTWTNIGGSSLTQFATHGTTSTIAGGESIFTFFSTAGGVNSQTLTAVRDLGNSILGGGLVTAVSTTNTNIYPDGPDQVTVCVTPLATNAAVAARLMWKEAQA